MTDSFTEHVEPALASARPMPRRFWGAVPLGSGRVEIICVTATWGATVNGGN
jgi:hypothetical protein